MNKVILTGNLCRDIELKTTSNNKEFITNCIAVSRDYKNANGDYESDFINIVAWNSQAVYLSKYASKGDRVELTGRWEVEKYTDSNGTQQIYNKCVVESIKAIPKPKDKTEEPKAKIEEIDGSDLPF